MRAIPIALAVGLFGIALTAVIMAGGAVDAVDVFFILLFVRLMPYAELGFAAFLLDKFFRARAAIPVVLASAVLIIVDLKITDVVFWQPQTKSTGGIAAVLAMFALVLFLIPGAIAVGLALTSNAEIGSRK